MSNSAIKCPECQSTVLANAGMAWRARHKIQRYRCLSCGRVFAEPEPEAEISGIIHTMKEGLAESQAEIGGGAGPAVTKLVRSIAEWVAVNAQSESIFLTPCPAQTVDAHDLLDRVSTVSGISKNQIGEWVAACAENKKTAEKGTGE